MSSWSSGVCTGDDGVDIHYLRTRPVVAPPPATHDGDGRALVWLHGLMGSGACFTPIARLLADEFDVVMPDARGHGRSSAPARGYRYDDHAGDVAGLVRALDLSRPTLVGHSMGGMVAAVVARRLGHALRGVVLVDPTFLSPERQREVHASDVVEQHRRALASSRSALVADGRARHPHRPLEIVELQAEARWQTSIDALDVLIPPNPDYRDVVRAIEVPVLLVIGDAPVVSRETADELARIKPRLRVEQIANAGHGLPFEQPARLADVVASFARALP